MVKLSHKGMCTSIFLILRIHSCFKNKPFVPALVIQAPGDFSHFAICFEVKIQDSRPFWKKELEIWKGLIKCHCSFLVALQTIPEARRPVTFPAREKQKRNRFQRLCGLLVFCSGAVAADGRLPKSKQHCTEKPDGKELYNF